MSKKAGDYFILGDLLITHTNQFFKSPEKLGELSRNQLLNMPGVFILKDFKGLNVRRRRELTKLFRIKTRHRWKQITGTWPPHQNKGWEKNKRLNAQEEPA